MTPLIQSDIKRIIQSKSSCNRISFEDIHSIEFQWISICDSFEEVFLQV
ncbi:hypothetical protein Hdeb2414_s0006g00221291 [Helianthus debilis subsp. tardiflorus]